MNGKTYSKRTPLGTRIKSRLRKRQLIIVKNRKFAPADATVVYKEAKGSDQQ